MWKSALVTGLTLTLALAWMLAGCDKSPTGPFRPPQSVPSGPAALTTFLITGPAAVAPEGTEQFRAMARYSDGTTRDVTTEASWQSSEATVLSISPAGLATGKMRGEATLTALFESRAAVKGGVMVLPPGTYRVSGVIRDSGHPVSGVRVEVVAGSGTGQCGWRLSSLRCRWRCGAPSQP
jgi:hypothetical protein